MWPNPQLPANLVTFIEEILNGKLNFLCIDPRWFWKDSKNIQRENYSLQVNLEINRPREKNLLGTQHFFFLLNGLAMEKIAATYFIKTA